MRAPVGGALSLRELPHRFPADAARLAGALVDIELLAEVTGISVSADVVAQRGAANLHGHVERRPDGARQAIALLALQRARQAAWTDLRAEQGFARVDVADPHHQPRIHDELLDGHGAPARDLPQVFAIEFRFEWLG